MTKKAKTPAVAPVYGPWMLCIWRGELDRCHYALVRFSRHQGALPHHTGLVRGVHAMFVDTTGAVAHKSYPPTYLTQKGQIELRTADLAEPTGVQTSVEAMLAYFKQRLLLVGGDRGAYEALGLERPQIVEDTIVANPEKTAELETLYERAAVAMKVPVSELKTRYSHLNRGLQAMNLRNRLRARGSNV